MDKSAPTATVVLAIDPGFDRLGWAVGTVTQGTIQQLDYGCITPPKTAHYDRYAYIFDQLTTIVNQYHPTIAGIETLYFSKNVTTALKVSEVRGVIISLLLQHHITCLDYHPNSIKLAVTGQGNATKAAVEKMIRHQLKIPNDKLLDDTLDAIAILLTHAVSVR